MTCKPCPTCHGDCFIDTGLSEQERLYPDATDGFGHPLRVCPTCNGEGEYDLLRFVDR